MLHLFSSQANGQASQNIYTIGEEEELCRVTLGYMKAFSRQYAAEVQYLDYFYLLVFWCKLLIC